MRIIGDTRFDFMGKRFYWIALSTVLVLAAIGVLATRGIAKGVEFSGGAQVTLRFLEPPDLRDIRAELDAAGLPGVQVTTFQDIATDSGHREVLIRVGVLASEGDDAERVDPAHAVVEALTPPEVAAWKSAGKIDLNVVDAEQLADALVQRAAIEPDAARATAEAIDAWRTEHSGLIDSLDRLAQLEGVDAVALDWLRENAYLGPFAIRGQEQFDPAVSKEMQGKAVRAILFALGGLLVYIWFRFQLQWGLAAIVALVHDTIITLGAFSLAGYEANLPVVAAFLTLVGYSVNDTIVIFDRIRENLRNRSSGQLIDLINESINQTLSRTLITSGTTWVVVLSLFVLGGVVIRPFAFVLLFGVLVGTYSSIFVASPFLLMWQNLAARMGARRKGKKGAARRAAQASRAR